MKNKNFSEKVIEFILTRSNDELADLTIQRITYTLKISRSHLYHRFKYEMKFTPGDYLLMIKMLRSANLLVENHSLSVERIAEMMGFSSTDYFKRLFRKRFGTTPGRYRKYSKQK